MSSDRTNTTTERKCTPNQVESSLSILCVPSKRITEVFIGDVSPSECKYYSKPLQWSYSQNIRGLTCNFPITTVSGLQLRRAHRLGKPSSRRSTSTPSPKIPYLSTGVSGTASTHRYSLFGASSEDPHVPRLIFASAHADTASLAHQPKTLMFFA